MGAAKEPRIVPAQLVDDDGNPVDVVVVAGVNRLAVQSVGGGGGAADLNTVTMAAPAQTVVGVASTPVLAANAARKYLALSVITPGRRVSFGFGAAAALDFGVTVFTGATVVFDAAAITTQAVNAIANIAATFVGVQEGS